MVGGTTWRGSALVMAMTGLLVTACAFTPSASPSAGMSAPVPETASASESAAASASASEGAVVADGEEWVMYQYIDGSGDGIFLVRPDGAGRHQLLTDLEGSEIHPDWSPDGQQIAFVRITLADRHELWIVDADGTDAEMLYSCDVPCNTVDYPDWAPDGSAIYYGMTANAPAGEPPTTFGVGRLDLATGEASAVLTRDDGMTAEQPRISPDGTRVVYARFNAIETATGSAIFVTDLVGGPERQLTDFELFGAHPDWAANDLIVFNTYDLGIFPETTEPANLYTVASDGTSVQKITAFGDHDTRATQPRWTPDGSAIVFTHVEGEGFGARRLAFISGDGTGMRSLTPEPISGTHPQVRPLTGG